MRFVTNSMEHRIAQVKRELTGARERLAAVTDKKLAIEIKKDIIRDEAVLRLLERTDRMLRSIGQK